MFNLRQLTMNDFAEIHVLIEQSVWALSKGNYSDIQIQGALKMVWSTDTQLIENGTYFVLEHEKTIIACGGRSYRQTLFGNNNEKNRDASIVDPLVGSAKIRAFFVLGLKIPRRTSCPKRLCEPDELMAIP